MKKIFLFAAALFVVATLWGQVPASFKYQAVLRDTRGNVKFNTSANIGIDILQGGASGTIAYSETHYAVTDGFGLISLEIGNGNPTKGLFSAISWGTGTYFVRVMIDGVNMGTTQLLSVPYALYAKTAESITGTIQEKDPLFTAWNKSSGIIINGAQVSDLQTSVTNNPAMLANSLKRSYPAADSAKLATLYSGVDLTTRVTGVLPLANGGTGSSTKNFVDLTTDQNVAGNKTFSGNTSLKGALALSGNASVVGT
jgi:hypothetical protein